MEEIRLTILLSALEPSIRNTPDHHQSMEKTEVKREGRNGVTHMLKQEDGGNSVDNAHHSQLC